MPEADTKSSIRTVEVTISSEGVSRQSRGEVRVQEWNRRERMIRAAKLGAMCWGMAIAAVLIPLLHFILVPSLLLAGPIVALVVFTHESVILGGEGSCPHCQKPLKIERAANRFPLSDLCTSCQRNVKITVPERT